MEISHLWVYLFCQLTNIQASPAAPATNIKFHDNVTEAMGIVKK